MVPYVQVLPSGHTSAEAALTWRCGHCGRGRGATGSDLARGLESLGDGLRSSAEVRLTWGTLGRSTSGCEAEVVAGAGRLTS